VPPGLTLRNCKFRPQSVFTCFVWISEQTAIIFLYSINRLVFITETECVYCAVRTERLNAIQVNRSPHRDSDALSTPDMYRTITKHRPRTIAVLKVLLQIQVFWNMTPCRLVTAYRCFEGSQCLLGQAFPKATALELLDPMLPRNVGNYQLTRRNIQITESSE